MRKLLFFLLLFGMNLSCQTGSSRKDTYVGEFKDGKRHGQGTLTIKYGDKYVGEFKDGDYNGQGTLTYKDGEKYVGKFKDGKYNGQGALTYEYGIVDYILKCFFEVYCPVGFRYEGEFKDGEFNGQGTWIDKYGKYVGEFKDGQYNGQGTSIDNGDKYVGEFKDGLYDGQGTLTLKNGTKYVGEFKDGQFKSKKSAVKQKCVCAGVKGDNKCSAHGKFTEEHTDSKNFWNAKKWCYVKDSEHCNGNTWLFCKDNTTMDSGLNKLWKKKGEIGISCLFSGCANNVKSLIKQSDNKDNIENSLEQKKYKSVVKEVQNGYKKIRDEYENSKKTNEDKVKLQKQIKNYYCKYENSVEIPIHRLGASYQIPKSIWEGEPENLFYNKSIFQPKQKYVLTIEGKKNEIIEYVPIIMENV